MTERTDPVNWSTLKAIQQSPKHYRHLLDTPREDSEAMQLGRLTHALVYEPDTVANLYVQEPRFHKGMKDDTALAKGYDGGKQAAAEWAAVHAEHEIVSTALWERADGMAQALFKDPIAAPMIRGGFAEQLITWTDAETGIECRGRVDHVNGRLSDLKSSITVDPRQFAAKAIRLGYHGQLAFYADGLAANGIVLEGDPALIVVESSAPFDVVVMEFTEEDIATGRAVYRECLGILAECREHDDWPGVSGGGTIRFPMPAWAVPAAAGVELTMGGVAVKL